MADISNGETEVESNDETVSNNVASQLLSLWENQEVAIKVQLLGVNFLLLASGLLSLGFIDSATFNTDQINNLTVVSLLLGLEFVLAGFPIVAYERNKENARLERLRIAKASHEDNINEEKLNQYRSSLKLGTKLEDQDVKLESYISEEALHRSQL
jgi:hypothetical protein